MQYPKKTLYNAPQGEVMGSTKRPFAKSAPWPKRALYMPQFQMKSNVDGTTDLNLIGDYTGDAHGYK